MTMAPKKPGAQPRVRTDRRRKPAIKLPAKLREQDDIPSNRHWRTYFLFHLVETSNITAAAKSAGIATSRAYRTRQDDPEFAAQWQVALAEGYKNLEMELLGYLRNPSPEHKMDVANAIRLLTLHRQTVAQQRAQHDDRSEQEVLDSIDAMIDEMRQRSAANSALLDEPDDGDEQGE
jgi:hypothetical protein